MLQLHAMPADVPGQVVIAAHGRIAGDDVDLLVLELAPRLRQAEQVVLDLDGVRYADREATRVLRRWLAAGLVLRGGSPFVRLLLRQRGIDIE